MKRLSRMIGVATLVVMATAGPAMAKGHHSDHMVPIQGTVTGVHWVDPPPPLDITQPWEFLSSGAGQMSHLGRVGYDLAQDSYFDFGRGVVVSSGTTTFTAKNGDTLTLTHEVESIIVGAFEGFEIEGTWTVLEGSGRFESASGSGDVSAIGDVPDGQPYFDDLPDGLARLDFTGMISYDASDRSSK